MTISETNMPIQSILNKNAKLKITPVFILVSVFLYIISESCVSGSGHSITSSLEDDRDPADNYGLADRFPPPGEMIRKSAEDHKKSTITQDSSPGQSNSGSLSPNRPDLTDPISSVSDPEAILLNEISQQDKIYIDNENPWIPTETCVKKYGTNDITQHAKKNPYFIGLDYEFDIFPKGGDLTRKLRAITEEAEGNIYQDQLNAEGKYDLQHKENVEAIFQSLAFDNDNQITNIDDSAAAKANMEAVFGSSTSELEQNNKNNHLNTADTSYIDNSSIMFRIAEIFGTSPTDYNNLNFKRNIDEKNYQGSLQAAIYNYFGPEVLKPSDNSDGHSITSSLEDDRDPADNYGLDDRLQDPDSMARKSAEDHKTSTITPDSSPGQSNSDSLSPNRPDLTDPDSSVSSSRTFSSPDTQEVSIPPSTSSPSISSPSMISQNDVDDSSSSTSSYPTATTVQNGSLPRKANSMLLSSFSFLLIYCFCLMAALVASL